MMRFDDNNCQSFKTLIIKKPLTSGMFISQKGSVIFSDIKSLPSRLINSIHIFEVLSGKSISIRDIAYLISQVIDSKSVLNFGAIPYRKDEVMESKSNIAKLKEISWKPIITLKDGILRTVDYEKQNSDYYLSSEF